MFDDDGWHNCHFCGDYVKDGYDSKGNQHYLSDCRPDLLEHEPGEICTWHGLNREYSCYVYRNPDTDQWGKEHTHFYKDGPM